MSIVQLDLCGLKCPLPVLRTRKALAQLMPGQRIEVHCTDPLALIDIPNLVRETGDLIESTCRDTHRVIFLIERTRRERK